LRLTLPPWKIGVKRLGVTCQTLESAFRRFEKSPLIVPRRPVSEMVGKKRALAAPTLALAATSSCSAPSTSGRLSRSEAGRPAGTAGGTFSSESGPPRSIGPGNRPSRSGAFSWSRSAANLG
jgi:hypothetical protein